MALGEQHLAEDDLRFAVATLAAAARSV